MLLTFTFSNFGPYAEESTFDMRTVPSYKEHAYNTERLENGDCALKVAVIYGANASGKTQFVHAYQCFRRIALNSFRGSSADSFKGREKEPLSNEKEYLASCYYPYFFCDDPQDTEFDVVFESPKAVYNYGFSYNEREITAEWLYITSNSTKRQSMVIERSIETGIKLGASVRRECAKYLPNIPSNVLALSFFDSLTLDSSVFSDTIREIDSAFPVLGLMGGGEVDRLLDSYFANFYHEDVKDSLIKYLRDIDLGIVDFTVEKNKDRLMVWSHHVGDEGETHLMPIALESDGTKKMIALYSFIDLATTQGLALIIDELDADLHPLLLRHIVSQFHSQNARGQLVFTAHDISLLDKRYLRRDQVWFSAKDDAGHSMLRSLSDFKVRNDASFEDSYLAGVFGAIPNIARGEVLSGN